MYNYLSFCANDNRIRKARTDVSPNCQFKITFCYFVILLFGCLLSLCPLSPHLRYNELNDG